MAETFRALRAAVPASLPYYLFSIVLLAGFIETFEVWQALNARLGGAYAGRVPLAVLLLLLLLLGGWGIARKRRGETIRPLPLGAGMVLAVAALALTDPAFPAKRIHVAEYILIALVVRKGLGFHVAGRALTVFTTVVTLLLGVHDELAQGLHPDRTFGLGDVAVNGVSGLAGSLIAAGLRLFEPGAPSREAQPTAIPLAAFFVGGGAVLLLASLPWFRDSAIPWWTMTPLLAGGFAWFLQAGGGHGGAGHPLPVSIWLALLTAVYPVIANGTSLVFH